MTTAAPQPLPQGESGRARVRPTRLDTEPAAAGRGPAPARPVPGISTGSADGRAEHLLAVPGADVPLAAARPAVLEALARRWPGDSRTSRRMLQTASELLEELAASGAKSWEDATAPTVTRWCWRSRTSSGSYRRATPATARHRQSIARAVFEEAARLGASVDPDAAVGDSIARLAKKAVRALTDAEANRVRKWADRAPRGSRQPLVAALAFAGGTATEIARVCIGDIDLDEATVVFAGAAARVAELDDWAVEAVRRYVRDKAPVEDGVPLCVSVRSTSEREVESVSGHLRRLLRVAGLHELAGVAACSLRLASARRVLRDDGVVAAARFLGWASLDRAADALGHNWRHPDG